MTRKGKGTTSTSDKQAWKTIPAKKCNKKLAGHLLNNLNEKVIFSYS